MSPFDLRHLTGPFDIVGDVHGCAEELSELLARLGYQLDLTREAVIEAPLGRRVVFVGDLVDRGPASAEVLRIVLTLTAAGIAHTAPGNHDVKFRRWLRGDKVRPTHGLDRTIAQFDASGADLKRRAEHFLAELPDYLWLDDGRLLVAHAGILARMIGKSDGETRNFCIYGDTDGKTDAAGLAIRYNWAAGYAGEATVVYGHTPVAEATWLNNTVCIDTGCCFGGALSALRWPEREIVAVPARARYWAPARLPGLPPPRPTPRP
jgi:protein phosphatase